MRIKKTLAVAAVTALSLVAACGSGGDTSEDAPSSDAFAASSIAYDDGKSCSIDTPSKDLTFGIHAEPSGGLDPAAPAQYGPSTQLAAIYGTLMNYNYDSNEFEPELAEALESNDDNTVWTLTLKDGVTFGDGTPMTAESVKSSVERFTSADYAGPWAGQASLVEKVDVVDERKLIFTLGKSWGTFPYLLTQNPGMIVNPAALDRVGADQLAKMAPKDAGAGAFIAQSYTAGQDVVLEGRDDWWGGTVCIEKLTIQYIADGQTAYETFKAGQLDGFQTFTTSVQRKLFDDENPQYVLPTFLLSPVVLNLDDGGGIADPEVRKALQLALDLDSINERIFDGMAVPTSGVLDPEMATAPEVDPVGYDLDEATEVLEAAVKDGDLDGMKYINTSASMQENLGILHASMWKAAGLKIDRSSVPQSQLVQQVFVDKNFEAVQWGFPMDSACVWCGLGMIRSGERTNISEYSNVDMDAALEGLRSAATADEVSGSMDEVQKIWNETAPMAMTGLLRYSIPVTDEVHGLRLGTGSMVRFEKTYLN